MFFPKRQSKHEPQSADSPQESICPHHRVLLSGLICIGIIAGCKPTEDAPPETQALATETTEALVRDASKFASRGDHMAAENAASRVLVNDPLNERAIRIAMEARANQNNQAGAADLAERLAEFVVNEKHQVLLKAFGWRMQSGDFAKAETNLLTALQHAPHSPILHRAAGQLFNAQGRRFEANKHFLELAKLDAISPDELLGLIDTSGPFSLISYDNVVPPNTPTLFKLGDARNAYFRSNDAATALQMISQARVSNPQNAAAAALEGRIHAEAGNTKQLALWAHSLPDDIRQHPEYWYALAVSLQRQQRHHEAIRAFSESLLRDPTDRQSIRKMLASASASNAPKSHNNSEPGVLSVSEIAKLRDHLNELDNIYRDAKSASPEQCIQIASYFAGVRRSWEAVAWLKMAAYRNGSFTQESNNLANMRSEIARTEASISVEQMRRQQLQCVLPIGILDSDVPTTELALRAAQPQLDQTATSSPIRLRDVANQTNLSTTLYSNLASQTSPYYLYEINGAGIAAIDYDLNGDCDLFFVQSGDSPGDPGKHSANQLFRTTPSAKFEDASADSFSALTGYGQGVCAGDLNQDGFTDLLVANIGQNQYLTNQGDGTFTAHESNHIKNLDDWTSSIAIGDINGDHLPDIIEVNYVDSPDALQRTCDDRPVDHHDVSCKPQNFKAASDRVHINNGDGQFLRTVLSDHFDAEPNYGFGVLIGNFDRQNGNDVFITNDGDRNHYWVSDSAKETPPSQTASTPYLLVESAGVRGCSIGENGQSQACMGLAAGDFDHNGFIDWHVTNFYQQPSNLFMQSPDGFFEDKNPVYKIGSLSFGSLGFGTQAADFDNNGWTDLAILNGHVYDRSHHGTPYQMPPQLLAGSANGFQESTPSDTDSGYWNRACLGRTLATLDWNRDGAIDLIANHLDQPVALLENQTNPQNWVQLELVGTLSEREAIGAEIRVATPNQTWTGWVTGGDGYMCTNEPVVHIGLANAAKITSIEIAWPSGTTQYFENVTFNDRYLAIEGQDTLHSRKSR